jgi:multiple antibiotic resistance protein
MENWLNHLLLALIPIFVAIDPIGLVPVFLGLTEHLAPRRRGIARQAVLTACTVSLVFMLLGRFIFRALSITESDFQVAGGLILIVIAVRELAGGPQQPSPATDDSGIVPIGMPLIAGPALLASLLILVDTVGWGPTLAALALNMALVYVLLRFSSGLLDRLGARGFRAVSKFIALLLAAIAVSMMRRGLSI